MENGKTLGQIDHYMEFSGGGQMCESKARGKIKDDAYSLCTRGFEFFRSNAAIVPLTAAWAGKLLSGLLRRLANVREQGARKNQGRRVLFTYARV